MADEDIVPICIRCGTNTVEAMLITAATIFWYCPKCGQIWGVPRLSKTQPLRRLDTLRYLAFESMCLADLGRDLAYECRAARIERSSIEALKARGQKKRAYHELVANHVLAVKWMLRSARHHVSAPSLRAVFKLSAA